MNPMLSFLAMVALMLATVSANLNRDVTIIEYGEISFEWLRKHFPNLQKSTASLLNIDTKNRFQLKDIRNGVFTMAPIPSSDIAKKHSKCGYCICIRADEITGIYMGPSSLVLSIISSHDSTGVLTVVESEKSIELDLHFASRYGPTEVVVKVPFFKIPSSLESPEKKGELEKFATDANVGLTGPDAFNGLETNKPFILEYKWLEMLLKKGIFYVNQENDSEKIYVTQPVLLPGSTIKDVINVLKKRNPSSNFIFKL